MVRATERPPESLRKVKTLEERLSQAELIPATASEGSRQWGGCGDAYLPEEERLKFL